MKNPGFTFKNSAVLPANAEISTFSHCRNGGVVNVHVHFSIDGGDPQKVIAKSAILKATCCSGCGRGSDVCIQKKAEALGRQLIEEVKKELDDSGISYPKGSDLLSLKLLNAGSDLDVQELNIMPV
jgi:hypothetical protein